MNLNCRQFESLITFYIDGNLSEKLKQAFESHMKNCPSCSMKLQIIKSVIGDIKSAYKNILVNNDIKDCTDVKQVATEAMNSEDITSMELSAYIDNELNDENNIRIRRNIIAKPNLRLRLEKMYKLKKLLSDSFAEHKNRLKYDYSKDIMRLSDKNASAKQACLHCILFVFVVLVAIILSIKIVLSII